MWSEKVVQKGPGQKLAKKCSKTSFPQEEFKPNFTALQNQVFGGFVQGARNDQKCVIVVESELR